MPVEEEDTPRKKEAVAYLVSYPHGARRWEVFWTQNPLQLASTQLADYSLSAD